MTVLAVDTTSNSASVAIRSNGDPVAEIALESGEGFAHLIFPLIENCLAEAKLSLHEIDCFAAASGPGSFTGVRVGLAAIKGLAEAMKKPAIGVSNLRASSSFGRDANSMRAVILDARRNEVYAAVYDAELRPIMPEMVLRFEALLASLDPQSRYEFVSSMPLSLQGTAFEASTVTRPEKPLASAVAFCAEQAGKEGVSLDPAALDANYVRRADAELFWRED